MLRTKNFGRKSLNEIKEILAGMGLQFGMKFDAQGRLVSARGTPVTPQAPHAEQEEEDEFPEEEGGERLEEEQPAEADRDQDREQFEGLTE